MRKHDVQNIMLQEDSPYRLTRAFERKTPARADGHLVMQMKLLSCTLLLRPKIEIIALGKITKCAPRQRQLMNTQIMYIYLLVFTTMEMREQTRNDMPITAQQIFRKPTLSYNGPQTTRDNPFAIAPIEPTQVKNWSSQCPTCMPIVLNTDAKQNKGKIVRKSIRQSKQNCF